MNSCGSERSLKTSAALSILQSGFSHFKEKGEVTGSKPPGGEREQTVFGLLRNFTRKGPTSYIKKRIFHTDHLDCGVSRKNFN